MKILVLSSKFAPHSIGGAERVAETLAWMHAAAGHEVVVVTLSEAGDEPERLINGVRVRVVPLRNVYELGQSVQHRLLRPAWHAIDSWNPFMVPALRRIIRDERPDVMHSHVLTGFSPSAWVVARDRRVPIVHTLHDYYLVCARSAMAIDGEACVRQHVECALLSGPRVAATRALSAVVGVSDFVVNRHRDYGAIRDVPTYVIPNPCHLVGIEPPARPATTGGRITFGFLGRIEHNKGIEQLLQSAHSLPDGAWRLRIAGTGHKALTRDLRSRYRHPDIEFLGRVDARNFLASIDVLVMPSLFPETFGMAAVEAHAMGIPVIASTRGALPEVVADGQTGFLFDPDQPELLFQLLLRFVEQPSIAAGMASRCRASAARLSPALIADRYLSVYNSVIA